MGLSRSIPSMGAASILAAGNIVSRVNFASALVSGPVSLCTPPGVRRVDVENAAQMYDAVMQELPGTDIFIATAAVADYRPAAPAECKIKKVTGDKEMTWAQIYDGKFWKAEVAQKFAIDSIPAAFLVDGDTGKILAVENDCCGNSDSVQKIRRFSNSWITEGIIGNSVPKSSNVLRFRVVLPAPCCCG